MFPCGKRVDAVVCVILVAGVIPTASCIASYCCECYDFTKNWHVDDPIEVAIKRSAQQVWHPIGRQVTLQADAEDWDRWKYNCGCYDWEYVWRTRDFNYLWGGSIYLQEPCTDSEVHWYTTQYTPDVHTITVTVDDDNEISQIPPGDTGSCNDAYAATDSVTLGAFDVKASLTVSGTNCTPFTMDTLWSEHDESMHENDPEWEEAEMLMDGVSLAGGPISLGTPESGSETITDESLLFSTITFRGKWVLSSEPDGMWRSDRMHWAGCWVAHSINGTLNSEVWDDDGDILFGDYVVFNPAVPSFGAPISWNWNRMVWDLIGLAGNDLEAEGGTGLGMVFQSDFFAGTSNWQNHSDVRHQSKDYYWPTWDHTPKSKTTIISYGPSGEWWQFDTSEEGGNSIELRGDIQGKIEIVECHVEFGDPLPPNYNYYNAYAKAWSEGWICFWLDDPYYGGIPQPPDDGYIP